MIETDLVGETLGDQSGVQYASLLPSALADNGVGVFHLAGVDVVAIEAFPVEPASGR